MNKKVLVLSAVTCVAGIVSAAAAGCSDSSSGGGGGGDPDATTSADVKGDTTKRPPIEAGGDEDAATCLVDPKVTPADFEQSPGYKPGAKTPDACDTTDLAKFEANLDDTNIKTWKDLGTDLSGNCAACIITSKEAANWGPVVYTDDVGETGFYNFGACFGVVEKETCGKAVQFLEWCLDAACDACTTQADRDSCIESAVETGCVDFVKTLQSECKNLTTSGKKCNNILDAAKTLCGPAVDGGDPDAGDDADAN